MGHYLDYLSKTACKPPCLSFGGVRFIDHWALNERKRASFAQELKLKTNDLSTALNYLKKAEGTRWISEVSAISLQQALRRLDDASRRFFKEQAGCPECGEEPLDGFLRIAYALEQEKKGVERGK
ncbi:MAG TPA: hypothetical protein VFN35_30210 [Ktedonobacteraceae bacterium]|nr:hypothetical protein [Ktedonobacteraceae bacterium]